MQGIVIAFYRPAGVATTRSATCGTPTVGARSPEPALNGHACPVADAPLYRDANAAANVALE